MEYGYRGVCGIWDDDIALTPIEAEDCLRNIVFCVDTREQPTAAFKKRMEYLYPHERETLSAGDYTAKTLLPNGAWFYAPTVIEADNNYLHDVPPSIHNLLYYLLIVPYNVFFSITNRVGLHLLDLQ